MIQRIDEGEGGCAIECSAVVKGSSDAHRCLIDIGNAEIDFSHVEVIPQYRGVEEKGRLGWVVFCVFQATGSSWV